MKQLQVLPFYILNMTSQFSSDKLKPNTPRPRQSFPRRAANWFRKPSFSKFKSKSGYSESSSADDLLSVRSSGKPIRPEALPATSMHNNYNRSVQKNPVIVPIMPIVCSFLFTDLFSRLTVSSLVLDVVPVPPVNFGHEFYNYIE